jgi:hypothetical protein
VALSGLERLVVFAQTSQSLKPTEVDLAVDAEESRIT